MLRCLFNWGWFISLREGAIRAGMFPFNLQFPTIISVSDVSLGLIWILSRVLGQRLCWFFSYVAHLFDKFYFCISY